MGGIFFIFLGRGSYCEGDWGFWVIIWGLGGCNELKGVREVLWCFWFFLGF